MKYLSAYAEWIALGIALVLLIGIIMAVIKYRSIRKNAGFDKWENETERQFLLDLKAAVDHAFKEQKCKLIKNDKRYYLETADTSYKIYRDKEENFHFIDRGFKSKK